MSGHTPGPWFAVNVGDDDEPMYSVKAARIAGKEPRHEVALCATGDSPQEMETANARLIAAAPEMLEALNFSEGVLARSSKYDPEQGETLARRMAIEALAKVRAAIFKAEGRQP